MSDDNATNGEIINILNPDDGKTYTVILSSEDSQRVQNDLPFAQQLLKNIRTQNQAEKANETPTGNNEQEHLYWSYEATLELIRLFESKIDHLYNVRKRKVLFENISKQVTSSGYECTPDQVCNKWKSLVRSYKSANLVKSKTGKMPTRFMFFSEMDRLMNISVRNPLDSSSDSSDADFKPLKRQKLEKFETTLVPHHHWSFEATIALITALEPYSDDILTLDNPRHRKHIFNEVANTLNNLGHACTKMHVQNKWKGLLRSYKASRIYRLKPGGGISPRFMYFDEMNKLIGDKFNNYDEMEVAEDANSSESSESDFESPIDRKPRPGVSGSGAQHYNWTYKASLALIKTIKPHVTDLGNPRKRMKVFERVADDLLQMGFFCNQDQVQSKWNSLVKNYNSSKEQNDSTGRGANTFMFFKEMDSLLSDEKRGKSLKDDALKLLYEKEKNRQERHQEKLEVELKKVALLESILEKLDSISN